MSDYNLSNDSDEFTYEVEDEYEDEDEDEEFDDYTAENIDENQFGDLLHNDAKYHIDRFNDPYVDVSDEEGPLPDLEKLSEKDQAERMARRQAELNKATEALKRLARGELF